MKAIRFSARGHVTVPKKIGESRSWRPGMEFVIEETKDGVLLRPRPLLPRPTLDQVAGVLKTKGPPKTLAEMDAGIALEVKRRNDRGRY